MLTQAQHQSRELDHGRRPRVAVVGGGIAGLTAAYRLGLHCAVTLYERHATAGLAFHGLTPVGSPGRVDIPLRVFNEGHYRHLLALYEELGIETDPIPHSCSYSTVTARQLPGRTFLRYGVGEEGSGDEHAALADEGGAILGAHATFLEMAARDLRGGRASGVSLGRYLADSGLSPGYAARFVIPSFAGICTCSFETAESFPADVALELLLSGLPSMALRRVRGGAAAAAERFVARLDDFRGGSQVKRIQQQAGGVDVIESSGRSTRYDHVVVATAANVASRIVALTRAEFDVLKSVHYERVRVVVHRDARLLPPPTLRGAFNFAIDEDARETCTTIWVNALQADLAEPIFQSVNPMQDPVASSVLHDITLERAAVSADNARTAEAVAQLNLDPARRIWFCGSYAARGVPLLETGVVSAIRVADAIQALDAGRHRAS